jgi:hypothetical protein
MTSRPRRVGAILIDLKPKLAISSRPFNQFTTAVWKNVVHFIGAIFAKRAFVTANERIAVGF